MVQRVGESFSDGEDEFKARGLCYRSEERAMEQTVNHQVKRRKEKSRFGGFGRTVGARVARSTPPLGFAQDGVWSKKGKSFMQGCGTEVPRKKKRTADFSTGANEPSGLVTWRSVESRLSVLNGSAVGEGNGPGNSYNLRGASADERCREKTASGSAE